MTTADAINVLFENADLIMVEGVAYLLAPLSPAQIDALAAYGTACEDDETSGDAEPLGAAQVEDIDRITATTQERQTLKHGAVA